MRWGEQLDVQQLSTEDEVRKRFASYLAKYTTKSTEAFYTHHNHGGRDPSA